MLGQLAPLVRYATTKLLDDVSLDDLHSATLEYLLETCEGNILQSVCLSCSRPGGVGAHRLIGSQFPHVRMDTRGD